VSNYKIVKCCEILEMGSGFQALICLHLLLIVPVSDVVL
jgi:hypothetical protein